MNGLLRDKVVVVSGAGPGLGRATAVRCAAAGADVVPAALDTGRLGVIAGEVEALAHRALDAATVTAGLDVDVVAPLRLPHLVADGLAERGGSVVVAASSVIRESPRSLGVYKMAKTALTALAQALSSELGPRGIQVNTIAPGMIWADAVKTHFAHLGTRTGGPRPCGWCMRRRCSVHSSFCSAGTAPTRRTMVVRSGKIPTTSVRRRISLFSRSRGLLDQFWRQAGLGKAAKARMSSRASSRCSAAAGNLASSAATTWPCWANTASRSGRPFWRIPAAPCSEGLEQGVQEAEFVAFRVGRDMPALGAGLADVDGLGAESEQPLQFGVLIPVGGVDVDVQSELPGPRVAAGAEDEGGLRAAEAGAGRPDMKEPRRELARIGIVVRGKGKRQYWRGSGRR